MSIRLRQTVLVPVLGVVAVAGLLITGLSGCGEPTYTNPTVYPVKGQVLLPDGKPLTSGQIILVSRQGREFPGKVESDGHFAIKSQAGEGAPEGEYLVRIDIEATQGGSAGRTKKSATLFPFPVKYADELTSGLKVDIKPTENNLEPFKLTPGPAATKSATGK